METTTFLETLASKEPVPGGGGASAFVGALAASLGSMVANLTTGKKKYAAYEEDIQKILKEAEARRESLYGLIQKDAEAFAPLAKAYGLPKDAENRDSIMESALVTACEPPLSIMRETTAVVDFLEILQTEGSLLAISDVGVAATCARAALEGAVMNVFINTKCMKNREKAMQIDSEARMLLENGTKRCETIYKHVMEEL